MNYKAYEDENNVEEAEAMTSSGHQPLISNRPLEDEEEQQPTSTMKAKVEEQEEFRGRKALDSSDGPSTQQLADSFQAQGDKLAEALADIFLFSCSF